MKITALKNILKEVNEPNEYLMIPFDLGHPLYWIFRIQTIRVKTLFSKLEDVRKPSARFDVFFNGQFIGENDYKFEQKENDFYIKFIKVNFPEIDAEGDPFIMDETDEIKIKGDIETF